MSKHLKGRHEPHSVTTSRTRPVINCSVLNDIFLNSRSSPLFSHLLNINYDLQDCCNSTYNTLFGIDNPTDIFEQTINSFNIWLKLRQFRITGSRVYELYTYSKNVSADWETETKKYFWPKSFSNKFVNYGKKFEGPARNKYMTQTGNTVIECGLVTHDLEKWLGYSPDGIVLKNGKPEKLLEIKCPFDGQKMNAATLKQTLPCFDKSGNLKMKHKFYGQVQMGMGVLNLTETDFVIYSSFDDSIEIITVPFNQDFTDDLLVTAKHIYFNQMLHEICKNNII